MKTVKGVIIEGEFISLDELIEALQVEPNFVIELVEYELIEPKGKTQQEWQFDEVSFKRARLARNFYHDLEINMPGIALALDLLERIEKLEHELNQK